MILIIHFAAWKSKIAKKNHPNVPANQEKPRAGIPHKSPFRQKLHKSLFQSKNAVSCRGGYWFLNVAYYFQVPPAYTLLSAGTPMDGVVK